MASSIGSVSASLPPQSSFIMAYPLDETIVGTSVRKSGRRIRASALILICRKSTKQLVASPAGSALGLQPSHLARAPGHTAPAFPSRTPASCRSIGRSEAQYWQSPGSSNFLPAVCRLLRTASELSRSVRWKRGTPNVWARIRHSSAFIDPPNVSA